MLGGEPRHLCSNFVKYDVFISNSQNINKVRTKVNTIKKKQNEKYLTKNKYETHKTVNLNEYKLDKRNHMV